MSSKRLRVLWITPRLLSGTPDGARHATIALVKQLTQRGVALDLICLPMGTVPSSTDDRATYGLHHLVTIARRPSLLASPPSLFAPWTFRTFRTQAVRAAMRREIQRFRSSLAPGETAVVVFDGLHTAAALTSEDRAALVKSCSGTIYRAHNFETELWEQCVVKARSPWRRAFFSYQTALVQRFEGELARQVSWIATVSEQDAERFTRLAPGARTVVTPIGMDFPAEDQVKPVSSTEGLDLLFIGRLDWLPNREGLKWFLDQVWKPVRARRPGVTLAIAGIGNSAWLDPYRSWTGIQFLGEVSQVEALYQSSTLAIAPLFQGSGTRVKIIEAARYARPSISTALGAQGGGLEPGVSYLRAETAQEWIDALSTVSVSQCGEVGSQAFKAGRARFDASKIAERFEMSLGA